MCRLTVTRIVTVASPDGLHLRAATSIADMVRRFESKVEIVKGSDRVDAINVLQVISLTAQAGEELMLEADGHDAEMALDGLARLFANRFEGELTSSEQQTE